MAASNTQVKKKVGIEAIEALRKENPKLYQAIADSQYDQMKYLNGRIGQVKTGGKVRWIDKEDEDLVFYSKPDMASILAHLTVLGWDGEWQSAFGWWLKQEDRRQYSCVVFEPDEKKVPKGALNLFKGFKIAPQAKPGGCSIFYDHLLRNGCQGNETHNKLMLDWMAHLFQRPGVKIGFAPVLYGDEGSGKSKIGDILAACIGEEYCLVADTADALTGKHNARHLKALLFQVEEAINPRDPTHESRLKHMITGGRVVIEPKGIDAFEVQSKSNLIFTSNKVHAVPASAGARRFFALEVGNGNRKDKAFFRAMDEQMEAGGYAALVHDLLKRDLRGVTFEAPGTALLSRQIMASMQGLDRWWAATLAEGELPFSRAPELAIDADLAWPDAGAWVTPKALMQESAAAFARDYRGTPPTPAAIGLFLAKEVPGLAPGRRGPERERVYQLPPLEVCRAAFVASRPGLRLADVTEATPNVGDIGDTASAAALPASAVVVPLRAANAA